jgi:hypothetical protein
MCTNDIVGSVKQNNTVYVEQSIVHTNLLFMPYCNDVASYEYKI